MMRCISISLISMVLIIVGCSQSSTPEPTVTKTRSPTQTRTATNTITPTATITPTPTLTNTPKPTSTETPNPTPFGGGSGDFIYVLTIDEEEEYYRSYVPFSFSDGIIISKDQLESILDTEMMRFFTIPSPDGKSFILYICKPQGQSGCNNDVYIATDNFSEFSPLLPASRGVWSPNNEKIVFTDQSNIYVINKDGSNLLELSSYNRMYDSDLYWSHDNERIYWSKYTNLRVLNADGSDNMRFEIPDLDFTPWQFRGLKYSSDGNKVALVLPDSDTDINKLIILNQDFTDPVITELDQARIVYITDPDTGETTADFDWCTRFHIAWSIDNKYVAASCNNKQQYFLLNTDSGKLETLPIKESSQICSWTPDNKQLAIIDDSKLMFVDLTDPGLIKEIDTIGEANFPYSCPIWVTKE